MWSISLLGASFGQDLARLASDERSRREANDGPAAAFTNVGVRSRRPSSSPPALSFGRESWRRLQEETRERELSWERLRYGHAASLRRAREDLRGLETLGRACGADGVSVYWTEPCGTAWAAQSWGLHVSICEAVPEAIRETERELARIRSSAREDARKLRIPAGRARLE